MPQGKDVTLAETHLAGTSHIFQFDRLKESLTEGTELKLVRELSNDYDGWAIRVETADGKKAGYVPRTINEVPARLLDAGFDLYGIVTGYCFENNWQQIRFAVKMRR